MTKSPFTPIGLHVWHTRYRLADGQRDERSPAETFRRVAGALASVERSDRTQWAERFEALLADGRFLPGGRILAGAGSGRRVTLFNCFVLGLIEDSLDGIFRALHEGALTMQEGGGAGWDFSTLRPRGTRARATGGVASGPVSFMRLWDRMCETLETANNRRGAMMATLRCDHPDVEEFIDAKRGGKGLHNFNLSVQVTDELIRAVDSDGELALVFPAAALGDGTSGPVEMRAWPGHSSPVPCRVLRRVRARELWARLIGSAAESGEPGFLFVDRINAANNLAYRERISATNPCGEEPLPPFGACNLGSLNLTAFVRAPYEQHARLDLPALAEATSLAVRFLDDVIDASRFPLAAQEAEARATRRVGLGLTGLADALVLLGLRYDTADARRIAAQAASAIAHAAYRTSAALAAERGAFPAFRRDDYLAAPFVQSLPPDIRSSIATHGLRNSHLTAIAPAGSISLFAGNVSSGIEPIFRARYRRALRDVESAGDESRVFDVVDHAVALWEQRAGAGTLPPAYADAESLSPEAHLEMQIALQPFVDSAISKTIQLPPGYGAEPLSRLCQRAYHGGLKGFTVFPSRSPIGAVLLVADKPGAPDACDAPACAIIE